jgi:hypothetical protein
MVEVRSSPILRTISFLIASRRRLGTADERGSTPMTEDAVFTQRRKERQERSNRLSGLYPRRAVISVYLRSSVVSELIHV